MSKTNTNLKNLIQPPLNTTMMGVLKAAADYYGLRLDAPMIFGLSGHAFLINIHTQICPSGPYCWKREHALPLIENLGLRLTDLGFFSTDAGDAVRVEVEQKLRVALNKGIPCSLLNLEHQIIHGYDDTGFFTAQPWAPHHLFPPATLSCGSWKEFGNLFHVNFYMIEQVPPIDLRQAMLTSLDYAAELWENPVKHSLEDYGVGPTAYDNWIQAVPDAGSGHGNWWNATVWSECRRMAADYFSRIADEKRSVTVLCARLSQAYLRIAGNLGKASDKEMNLKEKITLLQETKQLEAEAIEKVKKLAAAL